MIITLRRFLEKEDRVDEDDANILRRVVVPEFYKIAAVRDGIKHCIGNHGGPLALEFQAKIKGRWQRVGIRFDTGEEGWRLREFADVWSEQIVRRLKDRIEEILEGKE